MATTKAKARSTDRKEKADRSAKPASAPAPAKGKDRQGGDAGAARSVPMEKPAKKSAKTVLRESILARKSASKPIAFSLDEVRAIAKTIAARQPEAPAKTGKAPAGAAAKAAPDPDRPIKTMHVKAASIADILGFNPKRAKAPEVLSEEEVPDKYRRYFKVLVDMRRQLTEGIERHSEESLKRSAKDDSGDLSAYGQNMADGGINTFDRDFVLSLVSSEQEALAEIDSAIKRIKDGTYGICEITGKPISKERLLAVPFTRHSAEAQKELEKNRYRARPQSGIMGEMGEEGGKMIEEDSGGEE